MGGAASTSPTWSRARFGAHDALEWNLRVLIQVCNAVHFAHQRGILHRDSQARERDGRRARRGLRPRLGHRRQPHATTAAGGCRWRATPREVAGTPSYMAPEMWAAKPDRGSRRAPTSICSARCCSSPRRRAAASGREPRRMCARRPMPGRACRRARPGCLPKSAGGRWRPGPRSAQRARWSCGGSSRPISSVAAPSSSADEAERGLGGCARAHRAERDRKVATASSAPAASASSRRWRDAPTSLAPHKRPRGGGGDDDRLRDRGRRSQVGGGAVGVVAVGVAGATRARRRRPARARRARRRAQQAGGARPAARQSRRPAYAPLLRRGVRLDSGRLRRWSTGCSCPTRSCRIGSSSPIRRGS